MPKVVSFRNHIFTNAKKNLNDEKFFVLHCKSCETHFLITDATIESLPQRRTDQAFALSKEKWIIHLNTNMNQIPVKIKRENGIEKQYIHHCVSCNKNLCYQSSKSDQNPPFLYLIQDNIKFPRAKRKLDFQCSICGYVCKNLDHFEYHKKQRNHYNQKEGDSRNSKDADPDDTIPPLIVG